jgi:hypothetical protein
MIYLIFERLAQNLRRRERKYKGKEKKFIGTQSLFCRAHAPNNQKKDIVMLSMPSWKVIFD